jgi:hypothetical protein
MIVAAQGDYRLMATMTRGEMQDLVSKFATENPRYREALIADPKGTLERQFGSALGAVEVKAVVERADQAYVVIPHVPGEGELSDADLERVAGGGGKDVSCSISSGGSAINTYVEVGV